MKKLAVLTAVYNDQEGLERTFRTLPLECEFDWFIVDDGSVPPVQVPMLEGPHSVFVIRLEKNGGAARARNEGLKRILELGYEYVAILDAGDVALPGRFTKTVEFLDKNPEYALVGGQVRFWALDGEEVAEPLPTEHSALVRAMHARVCFSHSSVTFRSSLFREIGFYREDFPVAHDYELLWRVIRKGYRVANLPDFLVKYYLESKGLTVRKRRKQILNKLRVMIANFDPRIPESYLGLFKQTVLLLLPFSWVWTIKRLFPRRPGWL